MASFKLKDSTQVKFGVILSYILIILNALYGFFLTPFMLSQLGNSGFGVYKTITAFTSSLMVLDLGLGSTMMRYIARFRADNENEKIPNYIASSLLQATVLSVVAVAVMGGLYFSLDGIYSEGLTDIELTKAKQLYLVLACNVALHMFGSALSGVLTGYNRFTFSNSLKILRLLARIVLVLIVLPFFKDPLVLVLIDLFLTVFFIIIDVIYILVSIKVKIRFSYWDNALFRESFKYTILMFITSIAAQVNNNLDNVIIGAVQGAASVAIYSMGLLVFGMFENLSTSISGVVLPTVTNILATDDESYTKTQSFVVKMGRIQFMLLGAALTGFICLGRPFLELWLGEGYTDVYIIVLILMPPALLELCINTCLSILRAKNMIGFRTFILLMATALNAVITIFGTLYWGYFAAAVGTAVSFFVNTVILILYYRKKLGFHMIRIYGKIFHKTWICLLLSGVGCFAASLLADTPFFKMLIGIIAFFIIYGTTLLLFGMNASEKNALLKFKKFRHANATKKT